MLSASVEISLVYQVTSPLACLPEDEMMPRSSRMKKSRAEWSGVDAARRGVDSARLRAAGRGDG